MSIATGNGANSLYSLGGERNRTIRPEERGTEKFDHLSVPYRECPGKTRAIDLLRDNAAA
jgi:hypothetical protein